ncbi:NHLP family bacteriocin export ABC transporter peptidase/permease/ATPase subunit [Leptothoe spongobia]|uniref:NHLP family bacteriocin export ABC transporter peptidase/permease/ATPase subunit n=1 Tax=Leptothoe spongobia TAU-MAC 1115 TaxID=1967444 RepID=A0A947DG43_9CYAN|nr:NHLP family bacteriocin export ABC transporter peptidase/permease/ATPase subunit [Leptothoe spongobia]MBT9315779.1 NHLP family bacteriocin export ABC transporter peptidase/permease/ATPase subunit [Leptothoe spongobia TAU-MAC 1115]
MPLPFRTKRVHTPTLLQMEMVECGAAALGIILAYYKRIVPLTELRVECGVSRDGSKASNIIQAAQRYGLEANGYKAELEQLGQFKPPYIVFWHFGHFVVVEGIGRDRVFLNDPATGPRTVSLREFDEAFTGVVLTLKPGPDFQSGGQKPSLWLALNKRLKSSRGSILYCILAGFLLAIPGIILPVFSQIFVDQILVDHRTDWLRPLILVMAFTLMLQTILSLLQLKILRQLRIKLATTMASGFLWQSLRLPVAFYDHRLAGEVSNRLRINNRVADVLSGQLATTVISSIMLIFYAGVMFAYDGLLTIIGIIFSLLNVFALQWIARHRIDASLKLQLDQGKAHGVAIAGLKSMETIKASAIESDFFTRWAGYYAKVINTQQGLDLANQTLGILPIFLTSLTTLLILLIGGLRVINGELTIGMVVAFQSLMQQFQMPINDLVNFGSRLQELEGDLNCLEDVLQHPLDPMVAPDTFKLEPLSIENISKTQLQWSSPAQLKGHLELRQVTFGYSRVAPPLFENFNLILRPGESLALVGGSGSGKSTLAKLICGLYQPWSGEILLDGMPITAIPRPVLAKSLALVEQDIFLFGGTIRDNLTLWDHRVTEPQLIQACEDALIDEVVRSISGGLQGELMEGGHNLSGGQRQRLEIARALVHNPSILVMDEATSALDAETERHISQNLQRRQCTNIIVAHRLSTIRDCDQLVVLNHGRVVEQGCHDTLWQNNGLYTQLIQAI